MVKEKKQVKVLVTGAVGFLGDIIVENLLNQNHEVTVVDKLIYTDSYMRPDVSFVNIDVRDIEFFHILKEQDAVIHLASVVGDPACQVNPEETVSVNETFVKDLVDALPPHVRLIFASSCSVYGANNDLLDEDSPTNPLSLYAETKLNAEKYVSRHANHVIFRIGTLYGLSSPFGRIRADLVTNILTFQACEGRTISVFGAEQFRPMLNAKDAGRIFAEAVDTNYKGTFILSHKNYTILEIAQAVVDTVPNSAGIKVTDMKFEDLRNYRVDNTKAKQAGIYTELSLYDGISEMVRAYKIEGRIKNPWLTKYHNGKFIKELYETQAN